MNELPKEIWVNLSCEGTASVFPSKERAEEMVIHNERYGDYTNKQKSVKYIRKEAQ